MNTELLIQSLNKDMSLDLSEKISIEELKTILAEHINYLIKTKFETLISILYKIDINEKKLKQHLKDNPTEDASKIIASLIIERQQQKSRYRKLFNKGNNFFNEEESW